MSEPNNWAVLARYLSNECSDQQKAEIEAWMQSDPENAKLVRLMKRVWDSDSGNPSSDIRRLWLEVAEKAGISSESSSTGSTVKFPEKGQWHSRMAADSYRVLKYAAVFLIIVAMGYLLKVFMPVWQGETALTAVTIPNGDRDTVVLGDGTSITLDAGSTLKYSKTFTGDPREVYLDGEAFFEVARDTSRPFVVHANRALVTVLGTKFNVRSWQDSRKVTVAVAEGKVALATAEQPAADRVVLAKNQFSVLTDTGKPAAPESCDITRYLGWMHNEAYFEDTPLAEILPQLERWYDVDFVVESPSVLSERLNLHFHNDSIDEILELLSALTGLHFQRSGKSIVVTL